MYFHANTHNHDLPDNVDHFTPSKNYNVKMKVSAKRHVAKTISYRMISTAIGFMTMWFISGSIEVGAAFGLAELLWKPIQYYIHERVWYRFIKFGLVSPKQTVESDLPIMDSSNTTGEEVFVTTTGPKRLVYTKKVG